MSKLPLIKTSRANNSAVNLLINSSNQSKKITINPRRKAINQLNQLNEKTLYILSKNEEFVEHIINLIQNLNITEDQQIALFKEYKNRTQRQIGLKYSMVVYRIRQEYAVCIWRCTLDGFW